MPNSFHSLMHAALGILVSNSSFNTSFNPDDPKYLCMFQVLTHSPGCHSQKLYLLTQLSLRTKSMSKHGTRNNLKCGNSTVCFDLMLRDNQNIYSQSYYRTVWYMFLLSSNWLENFLVTVTFLVFKSKQQAGLPFWFLSENKWNFKFPCRIDLQEYLLLTSLHCLDGRTKP